MVNFIEILVKGVGSLDINTKDSDEFGIPLTFNISDIKDVGSRKASFSKTIKVLGTKNNNLIFNHLYEIKGQNFDFKMTRKHDAVLLVNKNPVLDGFLVLKKITKLLVGTKYEVVYEINLFDEVKNFFDYLGEKKLSDLDFSSGFTFQGNTYDVGDHILNPQTIGDRMELNSTFTNVYDYPIIDYGYNVNGTYPIGLTTTSNLLYPAVYQRSILDRLFYESSGFTYNSEYFDGVSYAGFFTNMLNLYNKSNEFQNLNLAQYNSDGGFSTGIGINWDGPLGLTSCVINGVYNNYYTIDPDETYDDVFPSGSTTIFTKGLRAPVEGNYELNIKIDITDDSGGDYELLGEPCAVDTNYQIKRSRQGLFSTLRNWTSTDLGMATGGSSGFLDATISIEDVEEGDMFWIRIIPGVYGMEGYTPTDPCIGEVVNVSCNGASLELIFVKELDESITTNSADIKINEIIPDMKQSDFMKNHIKIANLYIWADKVDSKRLNIEPRDEFFRAGETINWSDKVDYNKRITIKTLNNEISQDMVFELSEGEDFYSQQYKNIYDDIYGSKGVKLDNSSLDEEQSIKIDYQSYMMKNNSRGPYPMLYGEESDHTWFDERGEYKPLLGFIYRDHAQYRLGQFSGGTTYNKSISGVPIATHAKIMGGKSFDLNYETTGETFSLSNYDNERGLYKVFWENYIGNLIHEDARIVEYYINLTINDILNLDFRNRIFIDGQVYYLEKVNYDPTKTGPSKVTLLKEIDTLDEGSFETFFLLKNDLGDYVLTDAPYDRIIIN